MRTRPRKKIPFEALMISPEHINAFFGVDLVTEMNSMNLETATTSQENESKRNSDTNYNFNVTDNSLWRTIPNKDSQSTGSPTINQEIIERRVSATNYDFHVTDNPLWRTMYDPGSNHYSTDAQAFHGLQTPNYIDPNTPMTKYDLMQERCDSATNYDFHVPDNSLWRTRVQPSCPSTPSEHGKRDSATNYDFNVPDNSLWRTQIPPSDPSTPVSDAGKRDSATNYDFGVPDNSLWRTRISSSSPSDNTLAKGARDSTTNYKFNVSDNPLWRTFPTASELTPTANTPNKTNGDLVEETPDFIPCKPVAETSLEALVAEALEIPTAIEALEAPISQSMEKLVISQPSTPKSTSSFKLLSPKDAHFAQPTRASLAKIKNIESETISVCKHSIERKSPNFAEQRAKRQSVEAFTQTSAKANRNRRMTVLQKMHEQSPGLPRRSIYMPPTNLTQRPLASLAPFFSRLSSESNSSKGSGRSNTNTPLLVKPPKRIFDFNFEERKANVTPKQSDRKEESETPKQSDRKESPKSETPKQSDRKEAPKSETPKQSDRKEESETPKQPDRSKFFSSLFGNNGPKSGVIPANPPTLKPNAKPTFNIGYSFDDTTTNYFDDSTTGPLSQQISSQPITTSRKPFTLLNDEDFTYGSPTISSINRRFSARQLAAGEKPIVVGKSFLPSESRYYGANDTTIRVTEIDETAGVSIISGNSENESDDVNSPAPKHIVLRGKPKPKKNDYMYLKPPKIVKADQEDPDENPQLRRSKRTRLHRPLMMGEKPIYERDENGDLNLVGVKEGYTADPLCKKFHTFNKDAALEMQKKEARRKKRIRDQNKAVRQELAEKYANDSF